MYALKTDLSCGKTKKSQADKVPAFSEHLFQWKEMI